MLKRCIYNFPFLILYGILCAVIFFINTGAGSSLWDNYYIIAIPDGKAENVIESGVFGNEEVVSFYNTNICFNDFGVDEFVPLPDVKDRFIEGDPRIDPFVRGLPDYFFTADGEGNKWELIYVKSGKSIWNFYFKIRKSAGRQLDNWLFPEFSIKHRVLTMVLFSICWLFGIWLAKGFRPVAVAAGLPWIISIIVSGEGMLPAAVLIFLICVLVLKEIYSDVLYYLNYRVLRLRPGIYLHLAAIITAVIAGIALNISMKAPVLPVVISVIAGLISIFVYYSLKSQHVSMQEHSLFFPVSLTSDTGNEISGNKLPEVAAAAAAIILIPMFVTFYQQKIPVEVPVPQENIGSFSSWSWESLEYVDKAYEGLVNAADLVTHKAFQDGFMYGYEWKFPGRGEQLMLGSYIAGAEGIEYKENAVLQFTEDWYISIIEPASIEGLPAVAVKSEQPRRNYLKIGNIRCCQQFQSGKIYIC